MAGSPKVSFIIPVFNGTDYIAESVTSACRQDFGNYEVIVVDDGSTDDTYEVLKSLSEEISFTLLWQENRGVCGAMDQGLNAASGEYFCWGGHDDIFLPHRLQVHADFLDANPEYAACYSNVEYIDSQGRHTGYGKRRHLKSGFILGNLFRRNFIPAPASMVRTELARKVGGFNNNYHVEDYPLWLVLAERYPIAFVDAVVTRYRLHPENMSGNPETFYKGTQKILEDWRHYPACRRALSYRYRRWFCDSTKGVNIELMERYLKKLKPKDFLRPRVLRSYARYRACRQKVLSY